jgi:hypothetical protein
MRQEVPFTPLNRPWYPPECLAAMNMQFYACLSHFPSEVREDLRHFGGG